MASRFDTLLIRKRYLQNLLYMKCNCLNRRISVSIIRLLAYTGILKKNDESGQYINNSAGKK